jgi:hypothetical protein
MSELAKRAAVTGVVLSFLLIGIMGTVSPAAAQCQIDGPESMENCKENGDPSINPLTGVYENLLDLVKAFLQYGGFAAVFAGVTMWFMSDKDSRAQYGIWLMVGGLLMIVFFFANSAIIQLLKGIANGF